MPQSPATLSFNTDFDAQTDKTVQIAPGIARITAPNGGPYTFTGTNSFLIGNDALVVVDPGPDDDNHLKVLLAAIGTRPLTAILLTHTHMDHSPLAKRLAQQTGAPIWFGGQHRLSRPKKFLEINLISRSCDWALQPDRTLRDGDKLEFGDLSIEVLATPGHCANHLAFGISNTPYILTGDHVMGWNSTLVATPDGSMGDYFASLDKLIASAWNYYLPAHGGDIVEGRTYAKNLKAHRNGRNTQILDALSNGAHSGRTLLGLIYPDLPPHILRAARMTLNAHLEYLVQTGKINSRMTLFGRRYQRV